MERYEQKPELPTRSERKLELSADDSLDVEKSVLSVIESLVISAQPECIERTAYSINLSSGAESTLDLSDTMWPKYDNLSATFSHDDDSGLRFELQFQSPQKYDHTTVALESYGAWSVTPHDSKTPVKVLAHEELLQLLNAKIPLNEGIFKLFFRDKTNMTSSQIAYALIDELETIAGNRTDTKTYTATNLIANKAFKSNVAAALTRSEGPQAIDYSIGIQADGLLITPPGAADPVAVTNKYHHQFSVPYETGQRKVGKTVFSVVGDATLSTEYVDILAQSEEADSKAGTLLRNAIDMIVEKHLTIQQSA